MLRLRIVTAPQACEITPASDAATLTVCWQHANARSLAFLIAVAEHVPDALLEQWATCYRDAEFVHDWLHPAAAFPRALRARRPLAA